MKYIGEKLQFVVALLKKDEDLSVAGAVKQMCKQFDIKYKDSDRRAISGHIKQMREDQSYGR